VSERVAVLVNPTAGKGKHGQAADAVCRKLSENGSGVTRLEGRDGAEAADLARRAVDDGVDTLVVMGGDGMVHIAIQAVAYSSVVLGIIPTGTGNDVARYLGIPRGQPIEAAEVVMRGATRTIDLAKAGATYYATVLASGFDSIVTERANAMRWPRGQLRYSLSTLAELRVFRPLTYRVDLDDERWNGEAMLVAVGNGPSYGGGLRICEGAEVTDGLLDVVIIKPVSKVGLVRVYPRLFKGTHVTHPAYELHRAKRVSVAAARVVAYADGERIGPLPLTVDAAPAALEVRAPAP
jgi:diacylglycerol kinase (ATP)